MMRLLGLLAALTLAAFASPVLAQTSPATSAPAASEARCKAMEGDGFSALLDAPTHVVKASYVAAAGGRPDYCAIDAYVAPNVGFGVWMPATNWNGKYIVRGCGGFCGTVAMELACSQHIRDGYACLHSDMGHKSTMLDGKWAYNNLQAEVDFGYRATHVSTVAGKAITTAFYGQAPKLSYFMACSTGGRQGLVSAQRFPDDFDGIVANAPALNETGAGMQLLWSVRVNNRADGSQILGVDKIPALHAAVVARCDMNDGIKDGLIGDPRLCRFKPADIQCAGADAPTCLTAEQVGVVEKIYSGPRNSKGDLLYTGGAQPGSEMQWIGPYIGKPGETATYAKMQADLFRYMGFATDPGPSWQITDFDFDRDPKRFGVMEAVYTAANPDLRKFKARGGKMIIGQGWADQSITPLNVIDYYELATRTMGGPAATTDFFRLFMVPGMAHCSGGEGAASGIDYLAALEDWVEKGRAPDALMGVNTKPGAVDYFGIDADRLTPDQINYARPHFAYPGRAAYSGRGDPKAASSYTRR